MRLIHLGVISAGVGAGAMGMFLLGRLSTQQAPAPVVAPPTAAPLTAAAQPSPGPDVEAEDGLTWPGDPVLTMALRRAKIRRSLPRPSPKQGMARLRRQAAHGTPNARRRALQSLQLVDVGEARRAARQQLRDPATFTHAARFLLSGPAGARRSQDREAVARLYGEHQLPLGDRRAIGAAMMEALIKDDARDVALLWARTLLGDSAPEVRAIAPRFLSSFSRQAAIPVLLVGLEDPDPRVHAAALNTLKYLAGREGTANRSLDDWKRWARRAQ